MSVRVIMCGSRKWHNRKAVQDRLFDLVVKDFPGQEITIVHGAARGADTIAHQEAEKAGLLVEPHPAQWGAYGKKAGPIRNEHMAKLGADFCIAFLRDNSEGTRDMVARAEAHEIPVEVIEP